MFVLIKNRIHSLVIRKRSISYLPLDIWGGWCPFCLFCFSFVVCCGNDDSISLIIIFVRQAKNLGLLFGYWTANSSFKLMKKTFIQHESIVLLILFFPFLIFSSIYFSAFIFFFSYSSPSILIVDRHNLVELFFATAVSVAVAVYVFRSFSHSSVQTSSIIFFKTSICSFLVSLTIDLSYHPFRLELSTVERINLYQLQLEIIYHQHQH